MVLVVAAGASAALALSCALLGGSPARPEAEQVAEDPGAPAAVAATPGPGGAGAAAPAPGPAEGEGRHGEAVAARAAAAAAQRRASEEAAAAAAARAEEERRLAETDLENKAARIMELEAELELMALRCGAAEPESDRLLREVTRLTAANRVLQAKVDAALGVLAEKDRKIAGLEALVHAQEAERETRKVSVAERVQKMEAKVRPPSATPGSRPDAKAEPKSPNQATPRPRVGELAHAAVAPPPRGSGLRCGSPEVQKVVQQSRSRRIVRGNSNLT